MSKRILKNATDSILMGLEDFKKSEKDDKRILSCTRNIVAGILLLFKYKLSILSPKNSNEVLIKSKVVPKKNNGVITYCGEGSGTVNLKEIKNIFKSLEINYPNENAWKRFNEINSYRNNIEHYYSDYSLETAREIMAKSFAIIDVFIRKELHDRPENLFAEESWKYFLTIKNMYEGVKEQCHNSLTNIDFFSDEVLRIIEECKCSNCGSSLIAAMEYKKRYKAQNTKFICKACDHEYNYEEVIELYLDSIHELVREGEEVDVDYCQNCHKHSFLHDLDLCLLCGESIGAYCKGYDCNEPVDPRESNYCDRCDYLNNLMLKND